MLHQCEYSHSARVLAVVHRHEGSDSMPTELTDRFHLAAQVSGTLLAKVFATAFAQKMPGLETTVGDKRLTLWFREEDVNLVLLPTPLPTTVPVQVTMPFLARMSGQYDEVVGTIRVRALMTTKKVGADTASYISPAVYFTPEALASLEVSGLHPEKAPIWVPVITAGVKPKLAMLNGVPAGPLFSDRSTQFLLGSYPDAPYGRTGKTGVLAVFIWSGDSPPPRPVALNTRNIYDDEAVALVPRDQVDAAIIKGLQEDGLMDLPKMVGGVAITALSPISWREYGRGGGHFYFSGVADHPLGTVRFEAWLDLFFEYAPAGEEPKPPKVKVRVIRTKHDASFWIDFFDLFSAGAITHAIEEALPRAVGSIGAGAFGDVDVFATSAVPGPEVFGHMKVGVSIDIWPSGLGIHASWVSNPVNSSFPLPTYLRGHRLSREFHSQDCELGRRIKNPTRFPTWMRAIELGYNGCWHCQREYNVVAVGLLFVEVLEPVPQMLTVTARLLNSVQRFGITVRPEVEVLQPRLGGVPPAPRVRTYVPVDFDRKPLHQPVPIVPGQWEVTVSDDGNWRVTAVVEVGKAWKSDGKSLGTATVVRFEVGSPQTSWKKIPASL